MRGINELSKMQSANESNNRQEEQNDTQVSDLRHIEELQVGRWSGGS